MPDSQKHRPAISIVASQNSHLAKQLERATDIENQLTALSKQDEEKAQRRVELFGDETHKGTSPNRNKE